MAMRERSDVPPLRAASAPFDADALAAAAVVGSAAALALSPTVPPPHFLPPWCGSGARGSSLAFPAAGAARAAPGAASSGPARPAAVEDC